MEIGRVLSTGTAGHKREGREADADAEHGGDDVAAGGGSGVVARVKQDSRGGLGRRLTSK
jgi:hypothetical protein